MIERVFRRVQMLFGRGRITLIDDSGPVQMAQMTTNDGMTLDDRYRLTEFGFSSVPPVGSEVLAAHMSGDRTAGVVISTNHQPSRPRNLATGESMLYSEDGKPESYGNPCLGSEDMESFGDMWHMMQEAMTLPPLQEEDFVPQSELRNYIEEATK